MKPWARWIGTGLVAVLASVMLLPGSSHAQAKKIVVGLSQPNVEHPYRVAGVKAAQEWVKKHPEVELIVADGRRDSAKQLADVEDLITRKVNIIVIAPNDAKALAPIGEKAKRAGIPIVTFDRVLAAPEDQVAAHIGSDNIEMGRVAARYIAQKLDGKGVVIQLEGTPGASATVDRKKGFEEEIAKSPGIKVAASLVGHYRRHEAMQSMEDALTANPKIDAVYCHNDEMAFGALQALEARNRAKGVIVTGMDGSQVAFQAVNEGKLTGSVYYHHMFPEALELAIKVLKGERVPKVTMLETPFVTKENVAQYLGK
ncbi:MAG TPA: substrate-binding domain-containing protein [Candidatus Methylomirabilis sp.]|nr:substrate-binding domain-containing protein [Candidatus Methylomirabilis sp.]